ncbi:MAG TPA: hypothetical protein VHG51_01305, partial [Longimicrobiaceae bacterium]|nr:hypothetical protein [Longimicrobiaceae bacterium]
AALAAACASPAPQSQAADTASVAPAQAPAGAQRVDSARDTLLRPPAEPMDKRPWVPRTDTLRLASDTATAAAPAPPPAAALAGEWTAGVAQVRRSSMRPATLRAVRTGRHAGFDRVVFEFEGGAVPGYHLEYVDRPVRKCGSGDATEVAGQGWLKVRITPANAHTEQGRPTVADRERRLSLGVLRELELTCDFEADVTWVLGVASPNRYRVQELSNPARLVVDVRH